MPSYTCDTVNNIFMAMSGYISPKIYKKAAPSGPWIAGTPRDEWKDGMGQVHNSILWERTVPNDNGDEWTDSVTSDGITVDQCTYVPELIQFGQTNRTMRKQKRNIQTPLICIEDLRDDFEIEKMLEAVQQNLGFVTKYVWESRDRAEYIRLSEHKVTENAAADLTATSFNPATPPTSKLTLGTLEQIYNWLLLDGAAEDGSVGKMDGGQPVFDLYTDGNTSRNLKRQDPLIRQDFQFAFMGEGMNSPLLKSIGSSISWDGYRHIFDPHCQRFNIINGAYVRVQPYILPPTGTTVGFAQNLNPAYLYAQYQISVVHLPSVYTQRVPRPLSDVGGKTHFNPVSFMGEFKWLNIADQKCNPRNTKGFFDAVWASASDPGLTSHGFAIMHLNCPPLRTLQTSCYYNGSYG